MRYFTAVLVAISLSLASLLYAGPVEDSIVQQLRNQGFTQIEVRRTLLGRSRIVAQSNRLYREIIVNPSTGEILRDFWRDRSGSGTQLFDPNNPDGPENAGRSNGGSSSGSASGSGDDDDDDDDDDNDDDDHDDDNDDGDDGGDDGDDGDDGGDDGGDDD